MKSMKMESYNLCQLCSLCYGSGLYFSSLVEMLNLAECNEIKHKNIYIYMYDACMCMGSNPGQPGKNLSKMISQIRSNLNSAHLDMIIQIYSEITCGRVLSGELYTCKLYKLDNLCWSTGCFVKLHFTPQSKLLVIDHV